MVSDGETLGVRSGREKYISRTRLKQVGRERLVIRLTIATEHKPGEVSVLGWNITTSLFVHTSSTGVLVNKNNKNLISPLPSHL